MSSCLAKDWKNWLIIESASDDDEEEATEDKKDGEDAQPETEAEFSARPSEEPMLDDGDKTPVKPEPSESTLPPAKKQQQQAPHELQMYSSEELSRFKKKELLADVALLDGKLPPSSSATRLTGTTIMYHLNRTSEECKS